MSETFGSSLPEGRDGGSAGPDPAVPAGPAGVSPATPGAPGDGEIVGPADAASGQPEAGPGIWGAPPASSASEPGAWPSQPAGGWHQASSGYGPGGPGQGGYHPGGPWWGAPGWGPTASTSQPPRRRYKLLRPLAGGALIAGVAAAGIGIGHAAWPTTSSASPAAASSPGSSAGGSSGSGSSSNPFGGSGNSTNPFGGSGGNFFGGGGSGSGGSSEGTGGPSNVSSIAAKVDPALVDINVGFNYQQASGAGTGIVLTSNGEVLTNNHVIEGATSISVTDIGNGKTYSATVVGYDAAEDVAVLQLKDASGLQTAQIGDSSKVAIGDGVVAIGNAGGTGGTPSAAGGSITGVNQAITASDELSGTSENLSGLLETNADVQAGDSGGSLVNSSGQVIGMDTAGSQGYSLSSQANQGYAVPINKALSIAAQIEAGKSSATVHVGPTAFLGVLLSSSGSSGSGSPGGSFGYGSDDPFGGQSNGGSTASGAAVSGAVSGSAASQIGLAQGDVITSFDAHTVSSASDLGTLMQSHKPGDSVQIGWTDSSGQPHTATVTLGSGPAQ